MARLLFVILPIGLLGAGIKLIMVAVSFWIATTGSPEILSKTVYESATGDLKVKAFYPDGLKTTDVGLKVEIEVEDAQGAVPPIKELRVSINEACDFLSLDKTLHVFDLTSRVVPPPAQSVIVTRNTTPPSSCRFDVKVLNNISEIGSDRFDVYINSWFGQLTAVAQVLFGLVISLASLRGALAVLGIG